MTTASDEAALVAARNLRDVARELVRSDIATIRSDLAARPLGERLRQKVVSGLADTADSAAALARDNPAVLALTVTGLIGWFAREPLGRFARYGWVTAKRWLVPHARRIIQRPRRN